MLTVSKQAENETLFSKASATVVVTADDLPQVAALAADSVVNPKDKFVATGI